MIRIHRILCRLFMLTGACCALLLPALALAETEIRVRDDQGRQLVLPAPAQRIASLMPHATEILLDLGNPSVIAGIMTYPDAPPEVRDKPVLGDYYAINLEAVVNLDPDLIIAWPSANIASQLERLESLGYPIYYSEPQSFDAIARTYRELGKLTGQRETSAQLVRQWESGLQKLRHTYSRRKPVRTFYQTWHDPLFTANGESFIGHAIELCGGSNEFADEQSLAPQISRESVIASDPEIIIGAGDDADLDMWDEFSQITAVSHGLVLQLDESAMARPTLEVLNGTQQICELIDRARKTLYTEQ